MLAEDRATVDERLARASNSSNLKVEAERRGDGAALIAAGWISKTVEYVIGRHLIALHSEWALAEHPRAPLRHDIVRIAAKLPPMVDIEVIAADGSKTRKSVPRLVAAKAEAEKWYDPERNCLLGKLKTLPAA